MSDAASNRGQADMPLRILVLTQYYEPEPAFKFPDLVRYLTGCGHEVQVITGFPCYPLGRIYKGYCQRIYHEEEIDGALVTRLPQIPDHSRSVFRRALYYLSFALSAATIGLWRARQSDVILVYQSAFPIGLAAWVISRVKRAPYVLDVVDLWPESVAATGMLKNPLLLHIIRSLVQFIYAGARRINVITRGYWRNLIDLGVSADKLSLIHCWPTGGQFDPVPYNAELAQAEQLCDRFNIIYAGAIGPVQDLRTVIEAATMLRDLTQVQFVMIGDGVEHDDLVALAERRAATNVKFLGRVAPEKLQQLYPMAAALLVHLKPDPLSSISIPSKTFAYMAAGRPILMAVEGESSRLVESHGCGLSVTPADPAALAQAVRRLVAMTESERIELGRSSRAAYEINYCSERLAGKFELLLQEAAGRREPLLHRAA